MANAAVVMLAWRALRPQNVKALETSPCHESAAVDPTPY
jgi:hypothetical protein